MQKLSQNWFVLAFAIKTKVKHLSNHPCLSVPEGRKSPPDNGGKY
jgi:hypothetical protein